MNFNYTRFGRRRIWSTSKGFARISNLANKILDPEKEEPSHLYCTSWKCTYGVDRASEYKGYGLTRRCPDCGKELLRRTKPYGNDGK